MHKEQKGFCLMVRDLHPEYFTGVSVLDCGSLDVNGNNRYLFENCKYLGIDIGPGPNVDLVCPIHEFKVGQFDTIISTECFEHDRHYKESLSNIVRLLKPGGLFLFTCATTGRKEHGTTQKHPSSSPFTNNYYKNLTEEDITEAMDMSQFSRYEFRANTKVHDLYFWGVKL